MSRGARRVLAAVVTGSAIGGLGVVGLLGFLGLPGRRGGGGRGGWGWVRRRGFGGRAGSGVRGLGLVFPRWVGALGGVGGRLGRGVRGGLRVGAALAAPEPE